jgi:hypothetical protein
VLHPWPYAGIERVVDVWITDSAGRDGTWGLTGPQIRQLRQTHAVEDVVASNYTNQTVTGSDVPDDVIAIEMTGSHLQFLGLAPLLGRYFLPADAPDGQDPQPVAVLSYKFWQRHYRGDPALVGKTIQLDHKTYTILGVMPVRFTWRETGPHAAVSAKMAGSPSRAQYDGEQRTISYRETILSGNGFEGIISSGLDFCRYHGHENSLSHDKVWFPGFSVRTRRVPATSAISRTSSQISSASTTDG